MLRQVLLTLRQVLSTRFIREVLFMLRQVLSTRYIEKYSECSVRYSQRDIREVLLTPSGTLNEIY